MTYAIRGSENGPGALTRPGYGIEVLAHSDTSTGMVRATRRTTPLGEGTAILLLFGLLALPGCASLEIPKETLVPVAVPCIERPPVKPSMMSDEELLALDDFGLVIALARDRRIRQGYEAELEATLEGCR